MSAAPPLRLVSVRVWRSARELELALRRLDARLRWLDPSVEPQAARRLAFDIELPAKLAEFDAATLCAEREAVSRPNVEADLARLVNLGIRAAMDVRHLADAGPPRHRAAVWALAVIEQLGRQIDGAAATSPMKRVA